DGRQNPCEHAQAERRNGADVEARAREAHPERQAVQPHGATALLARRGLAPDTMQDLRQALVQHHAADRAEEQQIGQGYHQIGLTQQAQVAEQLDAHERAQGAAHRHDAADAVVDRLHAGIADDARGRGGDDVAGLAGHRHRRRDAQENQHRRHQESAADAEQTRHESNQRSQHDQERPVHRDFGDRQVNIHGTRLRLEGQAISAGKATRPSVLAAPAANRHPRLHAGVADQATGSTVKASAASRALRRSTTDRPDVMRWTEARACWSPRRAAIMYHLNASTRLAATPSSPFSSSWATLYGLSTRPAPAALVSQARASARFRAPPTPSYSCMA